MVIKYECRERSDSFKKSLRETGLHYVRRSLRNQEKSLCIKKLGLACVGTKYSVLWSLCSCKLWLCLSIHYPSVTMRQALLLVSLQQVVILSTSAFLCCVRFRLVCQLVLYRCTISLSVLLEALNISRASSFFFFFVYFCLLSVSVSKLGSYVCSDWSSAESLTPLFLQRIAFAWMVIPRISYKFSGLSSLSICNMHEIYTTSYLGSVWKYNLVTRLWAVMVQIWPVLTPPYYILSFFFCAACCGYFLTPPPRYNICTRSVNNR